MYKPNSRWVSRTDPQSYKGLRMVQRKHLDILPLLQQVFTFVTVFTLVVVWRPSNVKSVINVFFSQMWKESPCVWPYMLDKVTLKHTSDMKKLSQLWKKKKKKNYPANLKTCCKFKNMLLHIYQNNFLCQVCWAHIKSYRWLQAN